MLWPQQAFVATPQPPMQRHRTGVLCNAWTGDSSAANYTMHFDKFPGADIGALSAQIETDWAFRDIDRSVKMA